MIAPLGQPRQLSGSNDASQVQQPAFAVAGPEAWNSLPVDILSSETVIAFKSRLKTHLFKLSYCT